MAAPEDADPIIGTAFPLDYGGDLPAVDSRVVAHVIGLHATTINVWINRGIIPGVQVGPQGRARSYDASLVFHLAVMSVLVRLGYGAPFASVCAIQAHQHSDARKPGAKLIIVPASIREVGGAISSPKAHVVQVSDEFEPTIANLFPEDRPEALAMIDLSAIWNRVERGIVEATAQLAQTLARN